MSYDLHGAWNILSGTNAPMFDHGWRDQFKCWPDHKYTDAYLEKGVDLPRPIWDCHSMDVRSAMPRGFNQVHDRPDDINVYLDEGSP